ncbi:MAG: CHAP domain-containing protein, partial [Solirubrobacterales bacterium]|nr:CHAP domain-containing protein [Solirubrobacterales bacterium]
TPERARRLAEEAVAGSFDGFAFFHGNGQCTDWAFQKRPDVVLRAETKHYAEWLLAGGPVAGGQYVMLDWDGGNWARNARYAGLRTGRKPRVGALLAVPAGSRPGHVAYVEELYDGGRFRVTEYNFDGGLGVLHERVLDVAELSSESEFVY